MASQVTDAAVARQLPPCTCPGLSLQDWRPSNHVAVVRCKAKNVVFKVQFSSIWRPLSTFDPAHVRRTPDRGLHAKFRRRTSRRCRVYRVHTLRQLTSHHITSQARWSATLPHTHTAAAPDVCLSACMYVWATLPEFNKID